MQTAIKTYSQNEEQEFILKHTPEHGRFLDIGAWDPFTFSNTRALFERGWGGVLIEPSPGPFESLMREYAEKAGVVCIRAAVGLEDGETEMWMTDDAVSTSDPAVYERWRPLASYKGRQTVRMITIEHIYRICLDFDFVSIDAEGCSAELLYRLWDLGKRPGCICVEYDSHLNEIRERAPSFGYREVYGSSENVVLVR